MVSIRATIPATIFLIFVSSKAFFIQKNIIVVFQILWLYASRTNILDLYQNSYLNSLSNLGPQSYYQFFQWKYRKKKQQPPPNSI